MGKSNYIEMLCKYCGEPVRVSNDCTGLPTCAVCCTLRASSLEIEVLADEEIEANMRKNKQTRQANNYRNRPAVKARREKLEELKNEREQDEG